MLKKSLPVANGLGECILWDSRGNRALWSEVPGRELQIFDPAAGSLEKIPVHEELCSFGLSSNPDRIICAFQNGIAMTDRRFEVLEWIYRLQDDDDIRLNDGRVDRQGRFWVGSMVDNDGNRPVGRHSGQLFSVDSKGVVKIHFDGIRISNSLCWSPDGTIMYFGDTPRRKIYAFDFDTESGTPSNRRVFATTPPGTGPDGSTVDADGYLWNAEWGQGRVVRYAPDGSEDHVIQLPVSHVTCVCFGGPDLSDLYVTTATYGLDDRQLKREPEAGNVFVFSTSVRGLPESRYQRQGDDAA